MLIVLDMSTNPYEVIAEFGDEDELYGWLDEHMDADTGAAVRAAVGRMESWRGEWNGKQIDIHAE